MKMSNSFSISDWKSENNWDKKIKEFNKELTTLSTLFKKKYNYVITWSNSSSVYGYATTMLGFYWPIVLLLDKTNDTPEDVITEFNTIQSLFDNTTIAYEVKTLVAKFNNDVLLFNLLQSKVDLSDQADSSVKSNSNADQSTITTSSSSNITDSSTILDATDIDGLSNLSIDTTIEYVKTKLEEIADLLELIKADARIAADKAVTEWWDANYESYIINDCLFTIIALDGEYTAKYLGDDTDKSIKKLVKEYKKEIEKIAKSTYELAYAEAMMNSNAADLLSEGITSEENELVSGIKFNIDGSYVVLNSKTIKELMQMFLEWWDLVTVLKLTIAEAKEKTEAKKASADSSTVTTSSGSTTTTYNIEAQVYIKSAFDKFGNAMRYGISCPVCKKQVKSLKMGGFCSTECMIKYAKDKAMSFALAPNDKYADFQKIINELVAILDLTSLFLNALMGIPNIITELGTLPDKYKDYINSKINEGFCYLYQGIQWLMELKNTLIKKMMAKMKMGWIAKPMTYIFTAINLIKETMELALEQFENAYLIASDAIEKAGKMGLSIPAESFVCACTPRSYMRPEAASQIFVKIPGFTTGGEMTQKLAMPTALLNLDMEKIETTILNAFPPLTPVDYYLEPELFDIRVLFSDQGDAIKLIRQQLEDILTVGPDYLPKFENMLPVKKFTNVNVAGQIIPELWLPNLGYVKFLMGLQDSFAPASSVLYGSCLQPLK